MHKRDGSFKGLLGGHLLGELPRRHTVATNQPGGGAMLTPRVDTMVVTLPPMLPLETTVRMLGTVSSDVPITT